MAPDATPLEPWDAERTDFVAADLDDFLTWAMRCDASDICLQSARPAYLERDGRLEAATRIALDTPLLAEIAGRIYGPTAEGILRTGRDLDFSHEVRAGATRRRFRVNAAAVLAWGAWGINLTFRVLPDAPPALDSLDVPPAIRAAFEAPRGLTLVTGVPGSGKSTLLAAGIRRMVETGAGRIQTYEAPIEFVYDTLGQTGALVSSSEVGRHCESFAAGLRSSLRRRPAAVVVGEARDRETVEAALRAADTGIAVFSTAHTVGVAGTLRRLLSELPGDQREERAAALADCLQLVVTQMLLPHPQGGRTALREWLVFDGELRTALLGTPLERWTAVLREVLEERGSTMAAAADAAQARGEIDAQASARIQRWQT